MILSLRYCWTYNPVVKYYDTDTNLKCQLIRTYNPVSQKKRLIDAKMLILIDGNIQLLLDVYISILASIILFEIL
jgi:hypothetical protein